ncbi:MAG: lycopene cyclase domain-containing protein [Candidatus Omnitrophota bacterium]
MKEYTILAAISVLIAVGLDIVSGIRLLRRKDYYFFLVIIFGFKLLVNGYLTSKIVIYNPRFFLGLRLFTIPLEDFLFGFSMITIALVIWEYFNRPSMRKA